MVLEVQVRTGGVAVVSLVRDVLAGGDPVANLDEDAVGEHVPVDGGDDLAADVVVEDDPLPESLRLTRFGDDTVGVGVDGCADRTGEVDAVVLRPPSGPEAAGELRFSGLHGLGERPCRDSPADGTEVPEGRQPSSPLGLRVVTNRTTNSAAARTATRATIPPFFTAAPRS